MLVGYWMKIFLTGEICSFCLEGCIIILYIDGGMQDEK